MINIVLLKEEARECKSLKRGDGSEVLASRKGDSSDAISEVSGTANTCTDESAAAGIRGIIIGMSNHIITESKMIVDGYVDAAAIGPVDNIYGVYLTGGGLPRLSKQRRSQQRS